MHAILDLKSNGSVSEDNEAFEEGLSETCASGFLVHDYGAKLLGETTDD